MLISEIFWIKGRNEWEFHCNYDDTEREQDREDTGFLVIAPVKELKGIVLEGMKKNGNAAFYLNLQKNTQNEL